MDSDGEGWSPRDDESETRDGEQEQRSPAPSQPSQGTQTNLSAARGHATLLMPFCELEPLHCTYFTTCDFESSFDKQGKMHSS